LTRGSGFGTTVEKFGSFAGLGLPMSAVYDFLLAMHISLIQKILQHSANADNKTIPLAESLRMWEGKGTEVEGMIVRVMLKND
jgi:hypothetical protein